jgi:hypothetical protein
VLRRGFGSQEARTVTFRNRRVGVSHTHRVRARACVCACVRVTYVPRRFGFDAGFCHTSKIVRVYAHFGEIFTSHDERARLKARTIPLGPRGPSSMSLRCLSRGYQRIEMHGMCGWSARKDAKKTASRARISPDPALSPMILRGPVRVDVPRALLPSQCHRDPDT